MFNCRVVEDMLQEAMGHLPLGERLHCRSSSGAYTSKKQLEPGFVGKVFLTSFPISEGINADGIMVINKCKVQVRYTNSLDRV